MSAVARELGLDRTTLHHYFPSRDELVAAAMEHVMNAYHAQVDALAADGLEPDERLARLLDHAFGPEFNDARLSQILNEFSEASADDPKALAELQRAYLAFEDAILAELEKRFPEAPHGEIQRVAWAIAQLSEGVSSFGGMGLVGGRVAAARETADQLVQQLDRFRR